MESDTTRPASDRPTSRHAATTTLDDDAAFVEILMRKPELLSGDVLVVGEARGTEEDAPGGRVAIAWRRRGGAALLGVTTGSGSEALLVETIGWLAQSEGWPLARWDEVVRRGWEAAPVELRKRMAARWGLPIEEPWGVASWTRAAWGAEPSEGPTSMGVVATRIPAAVVAVIEWLSERIPAAAFRIQWYGEGATQGPRIDRVMGSWETERETPPAEETPVAPAAASDQEGILAELERRCVAAGCRVARRSGEWVRFDGRAHSIRAFPGDAWVDLQLVGIDEGALVGLSHRFGVALWREAPPGAPPGVHLRLVGSEIDPKVGALFEAWLGGIGFGAGLAGPSPRRVRRGRATKPRNADRGRHSR